MAVTNQKGGSGKTTTAVNLAACLGAKNRRVLLIDLDVQSSCTEWLGVDGEAHSEGLIRAFSGESSLWEEIVETEWKGVSLVPSARSMMHGSRKLAADEAYDVVLREQMGAIPDFDYVVMDCSPDMGPFTMQALHAAREVVVPVEAHFLAVHGLAHLLRTMESVRDGRNPDLRLKGIVACRVDSRKRHCEDVVELLRDQFGKLLYKTVIRENVRLAECPSFHLPITDYEPSCHGAEDYKALTKEVIRQERK